MTMLGGDGGKKGKTQSSEKRMIGGAVWMDGKRMGRTMKKKSIFLCFELNSVRANKHKE